MSKQIGSMHHVGIVVRDLRQAEAFVTAALGLPVVKRLESAELGVSMVFLACGPALVELIEWADPQLVRERLGDRVAAIDHVALAVDDLEHAVRQVASHGVGTVSPVPMTTPLGRMHFTQPETSAGIIWQLLELADGKPADADAHPAGG
jgi:catechol 2,3-dioxygenase-like lactoylglutathione lyase family enzyme